MQFGWQTNLISGTEGLQCAPVKHTSYQKHSLLWSRRLCRICNRHTRQRNGPGDLGAIVVVLTGLRSVFHWQENYLRFSSAREAVNAELRLYNVGAEPYDTGSSRDQVLVKAVSRIEQNEMSTWVQIATPRPKIST
jgi:hypothetical protein